MIQLIEIIDERGDTPYAIRHESLERSVKVRVLLSVFRLASGNYSAARSLGSLFELRLDFGPAIASISAKGEEIILLLGGGKKRRQQQDIAEAKRLWSEYKRVKAAKTRKGMS